MRKLLSSAALAAILVAMSVPASQATEGWYGRVDAGYSVDGEIDVEGLGSADLDENWMGSVGLGYGFMNGFRLEGELAYRDNEIDGTSADATAWAGMLNGYYDFNRGGGWEPYLGLGVGYGSLDISTADEESSWAWQAMAGLAIPLSETLDLDLGYRFFRMEDVEISGVDVDYDHQAVTLGLRWQFGAAAPPPPPPPPPPPVSPPPPPPVTTCPASEFVVYFEWDRSNLNQAALDTIDAAVARAQQCNVGTVLVVGHTDTSGSTEYNQGLSERRSSVVRDALVARGVPASIISTDARGESDLARPTADGVREPLNRRTAVTITFQ
jgi:outer membrane protein OmpA-like peptidoglycan-associated protein